PACHAPSIAPLPAPGRDGPLRRLHLERRARHGTKEDPMNLRPFSTVVGLFGPRREFADGRLAAYRILNAPASAIHPATQREAGREGRADAPRSPVGSPPISTPYGWSEDVV